MSDLALALRRLRRAPLFTAATILVLAVGVAAVAAMTSVANALFLRPLPIPGADRLVSVEAVHEDGTTGELAPLELDALAGAGAVVMEGLVGSRDQVLAVGESAPAAQATLGLFTTPGYFRGLGVGLALGREPTPEEPGVVVSSEYWTSRLGGDPGAVGGTLVVNGQLLVVSGVAPAGFTGTFLGIPFDVYVPVSLRPLVLGRPDDPREPFLEAFAVLRPGRSPAEAQQALARAAAEAFRARPPRPGQAAAAGLRVRPATGLDPDLERPALVFVAILLSLAAGILLLACANVANMLLSRAQRRVGELALRSAIGGSRAHVVRLMAVETLLLFTVAATLGLLLAGALPPALERLWTPIGFRLALDLTTDWRVVGLTLAVVVSFGAVFGLFPAWRASGAAPVAALRGRTDGPRRSRLRSAFVAVQVAVSFVLLVTTALFGRALARAAAHDAGLATERIHLAVLGLDAARIPADRRAAVEAAILQGVRALPGVTAAGYTDRTPLALAGPRFRLEVPGREGAGGPPLLAEGAAVSPGVLPLLGIPVLRGRAFTDDEADGHPVALVDSALARRLWPAGDAVGRLLVVEGERVTIVGVVGAAPTRPGRAPEPFVYRPWSEAPTPSPVLVLRSDGGEAAVAAAVREVLAERAPGAIARNQRTLARFVDITMLPQRVAAGVAGALGVIGLVLCAVGLYAVMAVMVAMRRRELAIRVALGAAPRRIAARVLGGGLRVAGAGLAAGLALAAALAPALRGLLVGVPAYDAASFLGITALLTAVVLAAAAGPALHAARRDPAPALKTE